MGAPRYNQEQIRQALEALMASAVLDAQGQWVPNVGAVSEAVEIHRRTLRRWWDRRDVSGDAQLRAAALRAREDLNRNGAEDWYRGKLEAGKALADHLLDPPTYRDLDGDKAARLFKLTLEGLRDLQIQLGNIQGDPRKGRRSRLLRAAEQVGLVEKGEKQ